MQPTAFKHWPCPRFLATSAAVKTSRQPDLCRSLHPEPKRPNTTAGRLCRARVPSDHSSCRGDRSTKQQVLTHQRTKIASRTENSRNKKFYRSLEVSCAILTKSRAKRRGDMRGSNKRECRRPSMWAMWPRSSRTMPGGAVDPHAP